MLIDLPFELLSDIVERLVREYLFEYFISHGNPWPWNAISALSSVSMTLRTLVHSLLSSALSIPSLQDGRLSRDPLVAISLARDDADSRFHAACLHDDDDTLVPPVNEDNSELAWWKTSPLLELYSVIRETRFRSDWITRRGICLRLLADLSKSLVDPMEKVKTSMDKRLVRPALVEGAHLIACTSFVGQLAASARFFELVQSVLEEEPAWVSVWYDNIDRTLVNVESLEKNCMIPLRWVPIERPKFVTASHIHASRIVPALNNFLLTPVIASDPICARWRLSVGLLLKTWGPLNDEIHEAITNQSNDAASLADFQQAALLEFPQDVSP